MNDVFVIQPCARTSRALPRAGGEIDAAAECMREASVPPWDDFPPTEILHEDYRMLATHILDRAAGSNIFNGRVECYSDGYCLALTATLILHRTHGGVTGVDVVWWDFRLMDALWEERYNDFDFEQLKNYLYGCY